jgi:glycosyltransferase involved in cell wall biosynthesis
MVNSPNQHSDWIPDEFEKGLVSVIVPTYNRANILTEALDSVWAQTYRPIELIVVDDGSIDNTEKVFDAWHQEHQADNQFKLRFVRQENGGAHSARNQGMIHSKGEYIQFLDSDDAFYPSMVAQVVRAFESTGCDFVLVGYEKICRECGKRIFRYEPQLDVDALTMYMKGKLSGNSISIARRRRLIQKIGPQDESLINDADGNYLVRTILQSQRMGIVRETLFSYFVRRGEKLSDRKGSHKSWMCYVQRETMFCEGIKGKEGIPADASGTYAQRLYEQALSRYNGGLSEIGESFGALADGVQGAAFTGRGRLIQKAWHGGRGIYRGYLWIRQMKQQISQLLSGKRKKGPACTVCGY